MSCLSVGPSADLCCLRHRMGVGRAFPEHYIRDLVAPWIVWKGSALRFDVLPQGLALETLTWPGIRQKLLSKHHGSKID